MAITASALFADDANNVTLNDGRVVNVRRGKAKHLPLLIRLFKTLLANMSEKEMVSLVGILSDRQRALLQKGIDPVKAPASSLADTTEEIRASINEYFGDDAVKKAVHNAFSNSSLIMTMFGAVAEVLPDMVEGLTDNLTKDDYEDLDVDEAIRVVASIVMVNYGFFSKSLPPIIRSFMGEMAARVQTANLTTMSASQSR